MFLVDYNILQLASTSDGLETKGEKSYQIDRLISLGLLQTKNRIVGSFWENADSLIAGEKDIIVTSFGKTFYQHMPKNIKAFPDEKKATAT